MTGTRTVRDRIVMLLATGLGTGYCPKAPGTAGSLLGPLLIRGAQETGWPLAGLLCAGVLFIALGIPVCGLAARKLGTGDPGAVVYDEIAAFWIVFLPHLLEGRTVGIVAAVAGFLWFRLFDILKPWPIRKLEHLPDGAGILADDLGAAVPAALCLYATERILSGF